MAIRRRVCAGALCAIALLSVDLMVAARELRAGGAADAHAVPEKIHLEGVANFAEVTPNLYRGAQPSQQGFEALAKIGIDIVVDLRGSGLDRERTEVTNLGMRFVDIPWFCMTPHDANMADFLELIRQNPGKKIFVHCIKGDDRTGMEIAAYRMAVQGWTEQEARREMKRFGFGLVHQRLCTGLGRYETHFPERFATRPAFDNLRSATPGERPRL